MVEAGSADQRRIRLGFHFPTGAVACSGSRWLFNLLRAAKTASSHSALVAIGGTAVSDEIAQYADRAIVIPTRQYRPIVPGNCSLAQRVIHGGSTRVHRLLALYQWRKVHLAVGLGVGKWFFDVPVPLALWYWDFQHKSFPEMFSEAECRERDRQLLRIASHCSRILAMSESVLRDFQRFAPEYESKVRVVRVAADVPEAAWDRDEMGRVALQEKYSLKERFFYLPNQFWKHKNHQVVIAAAHVLKERGQRVVVACTGGPQDYRHPDHVERLKQEVSRRGLTEEFRMLGVVPRRDVWRLIRESIAVINPSLFEGFALSVEEAVSLGKPVIASDIPAHHEFPRDQVRLFDPHCPEILADKMLEAIEQGHTWNDSEVESLRLNWLSRVEASGRRMGDISAEIVDEVR